MIPHAMPLPRLFARLFAALGLALLAIGITGCGGPRFRAVDYQAALARAKAEDAYTDSSDRDHSPVSFEVLTLASVVPDPWTMKVAAGNIESNASGQPGKLAGALSLATLESARVYLGETYERAYASFLGGIAYWMLGEDDNAAALWRNSLEIDKESKEGAREDFAPAHYLLAKYYWNTPGQRDTAELYRRAAAASWPGNPYLAPDRMERDNVVFLLEVGEGPRKTTKGPQGSILEYLRSRAPGGAVIVDVEGGPTVRTAQVLDVLQQAESSRRATGKEVLQVAKGTVATAAVGAGSFLAARQLGAGPITSAIIAIFFATQLETSPADTRQWWGIPAQLQVASVSLKPGTYSVRFRPLAEGGEQGYGQQTRIEKLRVKHADDLTIVLLRPLRRYPVRFAEAPPGVEGPEGIAANPDALARPGSTVIDTRETVEEAMRENSPLYIYLPAENEIEGGAPTK